MNDAADASAQESSADSAVPKAARICGSSRPKHTPLPEPPASHGTLVSLLALLSAIMGAVGYYAVHRPTRFPRPCANSWSFVRPISNAVSTDSLTEKEALRGTYPRTFGVWRRDDAYRRAQCGCYLFPDLLSGR